MNNIEQLQQDKALWNEPSLEVSEEDLAAGFDDFSRRIGRETHRTQVRRGFSLAGVAAACLLAGLSAGLFLRPAAPEAAETAWSECVTEYGSRDTVALPDGSRVILNSGSRIFYPSAFPGGQRTVFFSGEGFFDIARDTLHPFLVRSGETLVTVTGTRFNFQSYLEDATQTLSLLDGTVEVRFREDGSGVHLTPGHTACYDKQTGEVSLFESGGLEGHLWTEGEFDAYHKSFSQIAHELERRFGVRIIFRNHAVEDKVFYAGFVNNESVDEILEALNFEQQFKIERIENNIYIL